MRQPYWYFMPTHYYRPQNLNNGYMPYNKQYSKPCLIEEKYCDYFDLGDKAPNFTLDAIEDNKRTKVSLSDYLGKWVLIFFYGSDFTFV